MVKIFINFVNMLATVPCRQLVRWLPSDLVANCRVPARDRHSLPSQSPIFVVRLRSQPQPFVCCRWRSFPLVSEPSLPALCRHDFVIFATVAFRWPTTATMRGGLKDDIKTWFLPVSIFLNNDNGPEPDRTACQPAIGFWSSPLQCP